MKSDKYLHSELQMPINYVHVLSNDDIDMPNQVNSALCLRQQKVVDYIPATVVVS